MVILLQSLRDQFSSLYMGCMAEFTIAGPKDSCADLDCIKTVGCVPIGYSRIAAHARTHTNVKNASGVSNFAQTPDGQRRTLTSNRYAIAKRSGFNSTS